MATKVFKGTGAKLVDQLVEASQIRAPANSTYTGAGRELIPFFDMHEPVGNASMMGSLEGPAARRPANGNGARGSPRKAAAGRKDSHTKPESPSGSRNGSASPSHRRANAGSPQPGRASPRKAHRASPPRAVPAPTAPTTVAPATTAAPVAPAFRCPGFSQSPKPEMVPLPTFGLLQRAVARGIASSCKTSFSHGVSGMLPALQVAA